MPLIIIVRNKCKKYHGSSKRNFCSQRKKAVPVYEIHIFIISSSCFTFPHAANYLKNFPSSQLVSQLNRLERCVPGKSQFFSPSSSTARYKNPTPSPMVYLQMSTVSARSRRSYRKIEDYEQFISIRLDVAVDLDPDVSLPPSFPYPSLPRTQGPV